MGLRSLDQELMWAFDELSRPPASYPPTPEEWDANQLIRGPIEMALADMRYEIDQRLHRDMKLLKRSQDA